jgi:hypothetical protein
MTLREESLTTLQVGESISRGSGGPTVISAETGKRLDIDANPLCQGRYTATLAYLDGPVKLRQPVSVSIKEWSDGIVEAHLADTLLFGTGDDESEAIDDLRDNIVDAWVRLSALPEDSMAKPAWRIWSALRALCEEALSE